MKRGVSDICGKMQLKDCFKVFPGPNLSLNKVLRKSDGILQYPLGKTEEIRVIIHRKISAEGATILC